MSQPWLCTVTCFPALLLLLLLMLYCCHCLHQCCWQLAQCCGCCHAQMDSSSSKRKYVHNSCLSCGGAQLL
jgi:hypothetical protein